MPFSGLISHTALQAFPGVKKPQPDAANQAAIAALKAFQAGPQAAPMPIEAGKWQGMGAPAAQPMPIEAGKWQGMGAPQAAPMPIEAGKWQGMGAPQAAPPAAAPVGGFGSLISTAMPSLVSRGRMDINAPSGPSAALMSYDEAKAKYGPQRAREMQVAGQVGG